jgi:putative AlgH/UPF0301 family transcriptional regulator
MTAPTRNEEEEISSDASLEEDVPTTLQSLSREQRRRILLRLLFHRFERSRSTDTPSNLIQGEILQPDRPLRISTHAEALACNAVCRFCLGQANEEQTEAENNPYISPCNCSGSSEWVHLQCFRRWQGQAALSTTTQQAAQVCTVCRCTYHLPPRSLRRGCLRKGTLLVYMDDNEQRPSSFQRSFVLLLDHTESDTFGLIVNAPLHPQDFLPLVEQVSSTALPSCCAEGLSWRRGGPVSGGRLGVTRYCLAHTLQNLPDASYNSQRLVSCRILPDQEEEPDNLVYHQDLQFVFDATNLNSPAIFQGEELGDIIQSLTQAFICPCQQPQQQEGEEIQVSLSNVACKFIVFSGYCKWRSGQVQGEIKRGIWGVCNEATVHDILQPEPWQDLRNSTARIQTYGELLEEDGIATLSEEPEVGVSEE